MGYSKAIKLYKEHGLTETDLLNDLGFHKWYEIETLRIALGY